jgi:hypothetical protein
VKRVMRIVACATIAMGTLVSTGTSAFGQIGPKSSPHCMAGQSSCWAVVAVAKSSTTDRQISRFFLTVITPDSSEIASPGTYGLHYCSNPGAAPYKVSCVLWPSATKSKLVRLKSAFTGSHLFRTVAAITARP